MTDERMGGALWQALARLPYGAGIVFRHFATPLAQRRALFAKVMQVARRRRLMVIRAGNIRLAGEAGVHHARRSAGQILTWPAHSRGEAMAGVRAGADLLFVSPIFATRTHPGARVLGPVRAAMMMRGIVTPRIALGGITPTQFRRLKTLGFHGWAGIDVWLEASPPQR